MVKTRVRCVRGKQKSYIYAVSRSSAVQRAIDAAEHAPGKRCCVPAAKGRKAICFGPYTVDQLDPTMRWNIRRKG